MTFEPDISDDCLLVDGTETVTLHSNVAVSIAGARRGRLTLAEVEFRQVGLEAADMGWNLPAQALGDVEPRQGDSIEDADGTFWTILSSMRSQRTDVWRAVTRRRL